MTDVHVKAVPVNGLVQFVRSELTLEQWDRVLAQFSADDARWLTGHLLAHEAAPLPVVNRFTELAAKEKGEPVKSFARRAGRFGAELGLKSVYKFILAVMSVEYVLRKAPFMWSRVYDGGVMDVETSDKHARITVRDFPSNVAGCGRITGWFETIGEKAGANNLRMVHSSCMAEGGSQCVWEMAWK